MAVSRDSLDVGGLTCAACAARVEGSLKRVQGVDAVQVDVIGGKVSVSHAGVTRAKLAAAIRSAGYRVREEREQPSSAHVFWVRRGRGTLAVLSGVSLAVGLVLQQTGAPRSVVLSILAIATVAGGWFVVPQGIRAAMRRSLDMNVLMSIAAVGAWIIGEQTEAAATLFLFAIAELLESYSMDRARNAITGLMELSPAEATVLRTGREARLPVSEVAIGETLVVRPGEKIPLDGEVIEGRSSVNQAPITGESIPVDKAPGAEVFAGTLNVQGALRVRTTKPANDTTLARIIHGVEEAQASRAPTQTFVDRFARIYTPAVVLAAVLLAVGPPLLGVGTWETWIYRALAMLVVACPCALVISTPVSIVSGLAGAARAGILIKGGAHLESAGAVTTVCFDKTGTLTEGRPAVTDVVAVGMHTDADVLRLALGVEQHSEHPLARAIVDHGGVERLTAPGFTDFEALFGRGAQATVNGEPVFVGNARLMQERGVGMSEVETLLRRFAEDGKTAVVIATQGKVVGVIGIADRIRPGAAHAIRELKASGVQRTVMLTGDNRGTAAPASAQTGVDDYHAELLPDDKVRIVRELEASGHRVAFVGDGVNDAPALAAATVGIAMGVAGTDVALEIADIALMGDDLSKVALAIRLSRRTLRIIKQNIALALAIKAVFLILAVAGLATLWMAVAADMGASLLVVANGLRTVRLHT